MTNRRAAELLWHRMLQVAPGLQTGFDQELVASMLQAGTCRPLACACFVGIGYVMHLGQVVYSGAAAELVSNDNVKRLFLGQVPEDVKLIEDESDE